MQAHGRSGSREATPTNLVAFADLERRRYQRRARELLRWPIWVAMPEDGGAIVAAAVVKRGTAYDFLASPRLTDVELKIAAYACAVRAVLRGDDVDGIRFPDLADAQRLIEHKAREARSDLRAYVDSYCLGVVTTVSAA